MFVCRRANEICIGAGLEKEIMKAKVSNSRSTLGSMLPSASANTLQNSYDSTRVILNIVVRKL